MVVLSDCGELDLDIRGARVADGVLSNRRSKTFFGSNVFFYYYYLKAKQNKRKKRCTRKKVPFFLHKIKQPTKVAV